MLVHMKFVYILYEKTKTKIYKYTSLIISRWALTCNTCPLCESKFRCISELEVRSENNRFVVVLFATHCEAASKLSALVKYKYLHDNMQLVFVSQVLLYYQTAS